MNKEEHAKSCHFARCTHINKTWRMAMSRHASSHLEECNDERWEESLMYGIHEGAVLQRSTAFFLVNLKYGISMFLLVISLIHTNTIFKVSLWILLTRKSLLLALILSSTYNLSDNLRPYLLQHY